MKTLLIIVACLLIIAVVIIDIACCRVSGKISRAEETCAYRHRDKSIS